MSYPFVAAQYHGPSGSFRELRAIVVHMAEGGGTVSWLTHPSNANSSHFVIEYSGRIVQMVADDQYDYSLHVARPYGPPGPGDFGIYSLDVAKAVLGDGIADPNRYMYAVELEGYAANGPNAAQAASLKALVADLRSRFPSIRGLLGHRDFQNYKSCPGGLIPWASLGGHGLFGSAAPSTGVEMFPVVTRDTLAAPNPRVVTFRAGTTVNGYDPAQPGKVIKSSTFAADSTAHATHRVRVDWQNLGSSPRPVPDGYPFLLIADGTFAGLLVVEAAVTLDPEAPPVQADAGLAARKQAAISAVEAI